MKSRMAPIIPIVIQHILDACDTPVSLEEARPKASTPEFDLDSDSDDSNDMMLQMDLEGIDEQTSAIHCIGNLSLNCSAIMHPYL